MSEHARLGMSSASRWLACPASVRMCEAVDDIESSAAAEGTRAHEFLEQALTRWQTTGEQRVECDDEDMQEAVQLAFDYVLAAYDQFPGKEKSMVIEGKVDLEYFTGRKDTWGTADIIIKSNKRIQSIDYKHGQGVYVDENDNPQVMGYGLGSMAPTLKQTRGVPPWDEVVCTIIQPRFPGSGDKVRSVTYKPDDLLDWAANVLKPGADATDDESLLPIAGDKQCKFCDAKATCPAANQKVKDMCSVFQPVDQEMTVGVSPPDTLSMAQLLDIHDHEPFISGYLKSVNELIRRRLEQRDPETMQHLKLVRSRHQNIWKDEETMLAELTKGSNRILKKHLVKEVALSAPQALKIPGLKKAQKERLEEHIKKSEGSISIVPRTDPREDAFPALPFEAVTDEEEYDFI
jgi:hypothetical protein